MMIIEFIIGIILALLVRVILADSNEKLEEQIKLAEPVKVMVEIINGNYYGWLFDENKFILQASSKEDFVNKLKEQFPDRNLNLLSKEKITWLQENNSKT